ncbi:chitobiase/beta-hexosaminidase C-terminal domain-containing protein [Maribacter sp. ACAM166]|uniref:chitobiase/beta-hexosaminidase C-terminal domain-containing protein n=1 Tax=Maribacter sp. ACAM166 TaxID=2508996 RepID=UPI001484D124|nr:chitobiase/beta-hexosaminidase C-terminal domain-containing protein [Maribacter sp. ACAM166]
MSTSQLKASSVFFDAKTTIEFDFNFPDAIIRYALNGSVVNESSKEYTAPLVLTESSLITAKVFHPHYLESDPVQLEVLKISKKKPIKNIVITPSPNERYPGLGPLGLGDLIKGGKQFSSDSQWMGFQTDSITALITLNDAIQVSTIVVSLLTSQSSWIFAPAEIKIFYKGKLIGASSYPKSTASNARNDSFFSVPVAMGVYGQLEVVIYPLNEIPEWHQGKGTRPWFFMDEIIIQ